MKRRLFSAEGRYAYSPLFNIGLKTQRTFKRLRHAKHKGRRICAVVASNGGNGPFFWGGPDGSRRKSWQRCSEAKRRLLFKALFQLVSEYNGSVLGVHIYPGNGDRAYAPRTGVDSARLEELIHERDYMNGRAYQAPMRLLADFPSKADATKFQKQCGEMHSRM